MTRRNQVHKWTIYILALLAVLILDCAVLSQFPIHGVCPILLPLAVTAVAVMEGGLVGAPFGFFVGLLWVGAYGGGHGVRIILLTLVGLFVGQATQYVISQTFLGYLLCSAVVLSVIEVWNLGIRIFIRHSSIGELLAVSNIEFFYTICWTPLIYLLFSAVFRRVGGTKLA